MTTPNKNELTVELSEIKRLIVEKDPDDNDKFLRSIFDLAEIAEEMFTTLRITWLKESIEELDGMVKGGELDGSTFENYAWRAYNIAVEELLTRRREELAELEKSLSAIS